MKKRILLITSDLLPFLGYPCAGGGVRAWGLGEGLKTKGYEVLYSIPRAAVEV